eukprot:7391429-Prymnesium_polylepis.3
MLLNAACEGRFTDASALSYCLNDAAAISAAAACSAISRLEGGYKVDADPCTVRSDCVELHSTSMPWTLSGPAKTPRRPIGCRPERSIFESRWSWRVCGSCVCERESRLPAP